MTPRTGSSLPRGGLGPPGDRSVSPNRQRQGKGPTSQRHPRRRKFSHYFEQNRNFGHERRWPRGLQQPLATPNVATLLAGIEAQRAPRASTEGVSTQTETFPPSVCFGQSILLLHAMFSRRHTIRAICRRRTCPIQVCASIVRPAGGIWSTFAPTPTPGSTCACWTAK